VNNSLKQRPVPSAARMRIANFEVSGMCERFAPQGPKKLKAAGHAESSTEHTPAVEGYKL